MPPSPTKVDVGAQEEPSGDLNVVNLRQGNAQHGPRIIFSA